jgi:hypothetical protein
MFETSPMDVIIRRLGQDWNEFDVIILLGHSAALGDGLATIRIICNSLDTYTCPLEQ